MRQMKFLLSGMACVLGGLLMVSCSSEDDSVQAADGFGVVKLNLAADLGYQTKAVDESDYEKLENYTVQIRKDEQVVDDCEWKYADVPDLIELKNDTYELRAFYGEEKAASTDQMFVVGSTVFNVNSDQTEQTVTCKPTCAKVYVNFDATMDTYFSEYYTEFSGTEALGDSYFVLDKDKSPVYLAVGDNETVKVVIKMTKKSNSEVVTVERSYTLSPQEYQKITVMPKKNNGEFGISISIDKGTNDRPVDIEAPDEWVDMTK